MKKSYRVTVLIFIIFFVKIQCNQIEVSSYSKVAKNINNNVDVEQSSVSPDGPKIHRAREGVINPSVWFPTV